MSLSEGKGTWVAIPTETLRTVQFVGDYFCLTVNVYGASDEQAIANAGTLLSDHYGWQVEKVSHDITVQPFGE